MQDFPVQSKGQRDYWGRPKGGGGLTQKVSAPMAPFFLKNIDLEYFTAFLAKNSNFERNGAQIATLDPLWAKISDLVALSEYK